MTEEKKRQALEHFKEHGWALMKDRISPDLVVWLRDLFVQARNEQPLGAEKPYGSGVYWQGVDSLSMVNKKLFRIYTSDLTKETLRIFCEEAHCFIEEAIVKMPGEDFMYSEHVDRVGGVSALDNPLYDQTTLAWVLTDLTEENGALEIKEGEGEYFPVYAKAGDMLVWNDRLWHRSGPNLSDEPRVIWINFFTKYPIGKRPEVNSERLANSGSGYYEFKLF